MRLLYFRKGPTSGHCAKSESCQGRSRIVGLRSMRSALISLRVIGVGFSDLAQMSGLQRIADSCRTRREVADVPLSEVAGWSDKLTRPTRSATLSPLSDRARQTPQ